MSAKILGMEKTGLGFGNLSILGEESEDEGREDEIKELLAHAFSNETFDDDEYEEEENARDDGGGGDVENMTANDSLLALKDAEPTLRRMDGSLTHVSHCPGVDGDTNGNYNMFWPTGGGESLEELKTLSEFRERQVQRAEERVEALSKEKRSLAHQVALLRTEVVAMKSTEDELGKVLKLKDEEVEYLKEKVGEVLQEYENAKQSENETKDQNLLLQSQIEKLTHEMKLLSAIGLSTKESQINDALRETRQKHVTEITHWRERVAELEQSLQCYQRDALEKADDTRQKLLLEKETQTLYDVEAELMKERKRHFEEGEMWKEQMTSLVETLRRQQQNVLLEKETQTRYDVEAELEKERKRHFEEREIWKEQMTSLVENFRRQQQVPAPEVVKHVESRSTEVQTDETLETYRVLGSLIETWVEEVSEAGERARRAEGDLLEMGKGLRIMQRKFVTLKKVVTLCRKEWRFREDLLIKKHNASKEHYLKLLTAIASKFEAIEQEFSPNA